jgi:tetratricopeptide (TPR) repeat protein
MKLKITLIILIYTYFFHNIGFSQINPAFESIKQDILFADSLVIKNQMDEYIDQLKKEIDVNLSNNLDLKYYNLAVCYSAKEQTDSTCFYLSKCIRESSNYNNLILTDTDFEFLYQYECWGKIKNEIDSVFLEQNPGINNKELAIELYHIFLKDQHVRGLGLKKIDPALASIDEENLKRVEEIIQQYGWPTFSMVGKTAADGAFLVIQHSNVNTQRKYFKQLLDATKNDEASKESVALLTDRISVRLKGMQIFGTQVYRRKDSITGKPGPYLYFPIKDEADVDVKRKEMGLIPLKDYYALFGIDYKSPGQ